MNIGALSPGGPSRRNRPACAALAGGTGAHRARFPPRDRQSAKERDMRGVLLWLVGIPIPVIILLYLFHVI
jgi:hypothetical protein